MDEIAQAIQALVALWQIRKTVLPGRKKRNSVVVSYDQKGSTFHSGGGPIIFINVNDPGAPPAIPANRNGWANKKNHIT